MGLLSRRRVGPGPAPAPYAARPPAVALITLLASLSIPAGCARRTPGPGPAPSDGAVASDRVDARWLEVGNLLGVDPDALVEFETDRDGYARAHPEVFSSSLNDPGEVSTELFLQAWLAAHGNGVQIDRHTSAEDFLLSIHKIPMVEAAGASMRPALEDLREPAGGKALDHAEELLGQRGLSLVGFDTLDDALSFFVIRLEIEPRLRQLLDELGVFLNPYDTGVMLELWPSLDTDEPSWTDHWPA